MKRSEYKYHELRVKVKSLMAEQVIIKDEQNRIPVVMVENKYSYGMRDKNAYKRGSLSHHNDTVVAPEIRASLLATGFFRGREYSDVERKLKTIDQNGKLGFVNPPDFTAVRRVVKSFLPKYSKVSQAHLEYLEEWIQRAESYIEKQRTPNNQMAA